MEEQLNFLSNEMISNCGNLNYSGNITDVTIISRDNKLGVRQLFEMYGNGVKSHYIHIMDLK